MLYGKRRGQGAHTQQVVPAAVTGAALFHRLLFRHTGLLAQTGQGVKFPPKKPDDRAALTKGAAKSGGNTAQARFHSKALVPQVWASRELAKVS